MASKAHSRKETGRGESRPAMTERTKFPIPRKSRSNHDDHKSPGTTSQDVQIDHADCDGLNNRRRNLRFADHSQNGQNTRRPSTNTSGFKGVCWHKRIRKWQAQIKLNGKKKHLDYFDTVEEAAAAYDKAAIELFGEFARPNGVQLEFDL